ncbi:hypothetical protein POTOM_003286 [Populus tomentosa]|uniref:Uncharacterized protein n=1 Tax=Populus tomentosa TaxID=118781 RepID=A0A8X8DLG1_POPTO|nr:hypothetical protein POTOM_003286 [Populus tomentosa]
MKNHCKIVLCFLFFCLSSPTNSTSLSSQSSSTHSISVQHCVDSERTALLQLKRDLLTAKPDSSFPQHPSSGGGDWCIALPLATPNLQVLSLSNCHLSGSICESLNQLSLLSKLDLSRNNLSSMFPKSIMLLSNLKTLDLSSNTPLSGTLPEFPIGSKLEVLSLMFTSFSGEIPYSIGNLQFLIKLDLRNCSFSGLIPSSLASLNQLVDLDLSSNKFLGWIPFLPPLKKGPRLLDTVNHIGLANLGSLSIDSNSMEATLNSSLFELPSLEKLLLSQNRLSGVLQDFERAFLSPLSVVDLSMNNFEGHIPNSFLELQNLTELKLFSNNFSGAINLSMIKSIESLAFLQLSDNSQLTIAYSSNLKLPQLQTLWFDSCNVSRIPSFLRNQDGLVELGLSNNKIQGILPKWIWQLESLS